MADYSNNHDDDEIKDKTDEKDAVNIDEEFPTYPDHETIEKGTNKQGWKLWCDNLYDAAVKIAEQSLEGDTINACYNIDLAKRLKRYLLSYIPL